MTRVMRMVVDDSHAEIAVHNGNLDGQEDQKFGGVNEEVPVIDGQTSRDSPAASASVQHGDAQHSEGVGAVKNGIAVAPGGGDDDDDDDDDDQPPHDDRGGRGGPRGTPGGGDDGDDDGGDDRPPHGHRGDGAGPPSGGSTSSASGAEDPDRELWRLLDEGIGDGFRKNFHVVTEVTTFGSDNRTRKTITLTASQTHMGPKYWSAALQTLANTTKYLSHILLTHSRVDFKCNPSFMDAESPLHIDGMLGLVQLGLPTLIAAKKTSNSLSNEKVTAIKAFIAIKKGAQSQLRERLDEVLRIRNTKIVGHEELKLLIQDIGDGSNTGSIIRNLILQRIPQAAQQLGVPLLHEFASDPMQELMESWIIASCTGKPLLPRDQKSLGGGFVGASQHIPMSVKRQMLAAVKLSQSEGDLADISKTTLLLPGMRESLSHRRQVDERLVALRERAVVLDDSDSTETVDGDDDTQSVLSRNSAGDTLNSANPGSQFNLKDWWIEMAKDQTPENSPDVNSEGMEPISSQQVLQFLQGVQYLDPDQVAVVTLQAEVDRAFTTLILQYRDHQGDELKKLSDFHAESYSSYAAVQQQVKGALKDSARKASPNGGPLTLLHCVAMAEVHDTALHGNPPLSFWETAGATRSVMDLQRMLTIFHQASARNDQAPVSQVVVGATKVLTNTLVNLKLVEFKKQHQQTFAPVQIKQVYVLIQEVKKAMAVYMQKVKNSRNPLVGMYAVLHDNKVLENLYEQVSMAMRVLDTFELDPQDGTVPQMREQSDVQAQLSMYKVMQKVLIMMRISRGMFMLRPDDEPLDNWGCLRVLTVVGTVEPVMMHDMIVPWIYSKSQLSKPDNSTKPSKEAAQPKKVRQPGSSFTQAKGAYPEVVNSIVEKAFPMKSDDEALFWVNEATDVFTHENIYMTQSGSGAQDLNAGKVARQALIDGGDVVYLRDSSQKKNAGNGVDVVPVKPFLAHDRFITIHAQAKLPGATLITIEELLSVREPETHF